MERTGNNSVYNVTPTTSEVTDISSTPEDIQCKEAKLFEKAGQHIQAFSIYQELADKKNHAHAQFRCGIFYQDAKGGCATDMTRSISYLKLAADQQHPEALGALGVHYLTGEWIDKDSVKGLACMTSSADLGSLHACTNLGKIYLAGKLVAQDLTKAIHYSEQARGYLPDASYCLGLAYEKVLAQKVEGIFVNHQQIVQLYHEAADAEAGSIPQASFKLAAIYFYGEMAEKDFNKAKYYANKAVKEGHGDKKIVLSRDGSVALMFLREGATIGLVERAIPYRS